MASQFPGSQPPPYSPSPPPYQPGPSAGLVDRAKNILFSPEPEWRRIDAEPATMAGLFTGYAVPLAAIGPVASLICSLVFLHTGIVAALVGAIFQYGMALLGVFIISQIVNLLAPSFGGQKNLVQATKVAVYSSTAGWVAGILNIVPGLGIIGSLLGLYNLYLLWLGLPMLMRVPEDKKVGYFIVVLVAALVVVAVLAAIVGAVIGAVLIAAATSSPNVIVVR